MRIAYIAADGGTPVFGGSGASVHIQAMVRALADLGHQVTILAARRGEPDGPLEARIVEARPESSRWTRGGAVGPRSARVRARERLSIRRSGAILEELRRHHAREPFDVVYERYALWSVAGARASVELAIPCILEVNAPLAVEQRQYRTLLQGAEAEAIEAEAFSGAHAVVAVSDAVRRYVVEKGAPQDRVIVLSNGVDPERFHPGVDAEMLDGLAGKFVVGFVGSFKMWHGLEVLLDAFEKLAAGSLAHHLLLVGGGPRASWVEQEVRRRGLGSRVTMPGWVPHQRLPGLIQRMDVAAIPYPVMEECYFSPLKLFEYMAMGKPVVASRTGQVQDVVADERTGLLVRCGDPDELAAAIDRLRREPDLRQRLGIAAAGAARDHTWERNARRVTELAEELVSKQRHARGADVPTIRRHPYLFVVGCPRSGTTLLQRMLDHHPQLAVANDTHFIPAGLEGASGDIDPPLTPRRVDRVRRSRFLGWLGLPDSAFEAAAAAAQTYGEFVSALYVEYGRRRGKPLAGEKTPDYCERLPALHALFPWVKTIHIVRDGRDVALSTLEWARTNRGPGRFRLWPDHPVAVCALWWRSKVSVGRRDGRALGADRYIEVRYEDLVRDSEANLRRIAEFLELPFSPAMLAYHVGKVRRSNGLSAKEAWLPPTPKLREWRTQMPKRDVELFEALAGDLLTDLGYERSFERIAPDVAEEASHCERWWQAEMEWSRHVDGGRPRASAGTHDGKKASVLPSRPIFVLGNQRSGTTAIAALLAQRTGLSVTLDLPREDGGEIYRRIRAGQAPFEELIEAERAGFSRHIVKEPHLTVFFDELANHFPQARYAFVVRDPRACIRSILQRLAIPGHLRQLSPPYDEDAVRRWRLVLDGRWLGLRGKNHIASLSARWAHLAQVYLEHAPRMTLIRYEDFLCDKVGVIDRLARQLDLRPSHDIRDKLDVQYQGRGDHSASWEEYFGAANLRVIERVCGDAMSGLGYSPATLPSPISAGQAADNVISVVS